MFNGKYTYLQLDFIKELTNIGGGNAASSISKLINKPVDMGLPIIDLISYSDLYENVMEEDRLVNIILIAMEGDAEGVFLYILDDRAKEKIVDLMLANCEIDEDMKESIIKEMVNILVSSYLNSISKMLGTRLISTVPSLIVDMFGAVMTSVYIESGQYDEKIMIIKNEFSYLGEKIDSSLYFIPKVGVLDKLFLKTGL